MRKVGPTPGAAGCHTTRASTCWPMSESSRPWSWRPPKGGRTLRPSHPLQQCDRCLGAHPQAVTPRHSVCPTSSRGSPSQAPPPPPCALLSHPSPTRATSPELSSYSSSQGPCRLGPQHSLADGPLGPSRSCRDGCRWRGRPHAGAAAPASSQSRAVDSVDGGPQQGPPRSCSLLACPASGCTGSTAPPSGSHVQALLFKGPHGGGCRAGCHPSLQSPRAGVARSHGGAAGWTFKGRLGTLN